VANLWQACRELAFWFGHNAPIVSTMSIVTLTRRRINILLVESDLHNGISLSVPLAKLGFPISYKFRIKSIIVQFYNDSLNTRIVGSFKIISQWQLRPMFVDFSFLRSRRPYFLPKWKKNKIENWKKKLFWDRSFTYFFRNLVYFSPKHFLVVGFSFGELSLGLFKLTGSWFITINAFIQSV